MKRSQLIGLGAAVLWTVLTVAYAQDLDRAEACAANKKTDACWMELQERPDCYVWKDWRLEDWVLGDDDTLTWSGVCSDSLAQGEGQLTGYFGPDRANAGEIYGFGQGQLVDGKMHGPWSIDLGAGGEEYEAHYRNGLKHGEEMALRRGASGEVRRKTQWVLGSRQGLEVVWSSHGRVSETPYMDGQPHGMAVLKQEGTNQYREPPYITEVPYVKGKKHGLQTTVRGAAADTSHEDSADNPAYIEKTPWVDGEIQGTQVRQWLDGRTRETPWVMGKKHGMEIVWGRRGSKSHDSMERLKKQETPWVDGAIHGTEIHRLTHEGDVQEIPWVNGQKHGTEVIRDANGSVLREIVWANGEESEVRGGP